MKNYMIKHYFLSFFPNILVTKRILKYPRIVTEIVSSHDYKNRYYRRFKLCFLAALVDEYE